MVGELKGIEDSKAAKDAFYLRLWEAVVKSGSPGELAIFKSYYEAYGKLLGDRLPALIPQVYLHFDPFTQRQRGDEKVLARQRMDFLLMLDHGTRIVIEVDGEQHYGAQDVPGVGPFRTRPELYAEMVREDRRLKLRGYEVFRFGGTEFADVDLEQRTVGAQSKRHVTEFFDALLARHGFITAPQSSE
jgi:very-short-patch-repair endonuclease